MDAQNTTEQQRSELDTLIDDLPERGQQTLVEAFDAESSQRWSYRQIGEQVVALARGLRAELKPGDAVALVGADRPEWIIAALAIMRAGAAVTPLDVQLPDDTLAQVLEDSGARWIFTDGMHRERVEQAAPEARVVLLDAEENDDQGWRTLARNEGELPRNSRDATAALFYTSGTTGPPKGVPLSHGNLQFQLDTLVQAGVTQDNDRVLLPLPLHHVYPFVIGMLAPIGLGLTLAIPYALTGPQLVRAVREGGVTVIIGVPRLYDALFQGIRGRAAGGGRIAAGIFKALLGISRAARRHLKIRLGKQLLRPLHGQVGPQLRVLACGGAALDPQLHWNLEAIGWQVAVGYGLTETAPLVTIDKPQLSRPGTVGEPVPGVEVRIDRDLEQTVTEREDEGEILIRGPNVFSGYRNKPEKTEESLSKEGWFSSGDLGWLDDDNYLHVTGRVSTLIVTSGGKNIQPDELEARYAEHPAIREFGVLMDDDKLVGLVVPAGDVGEDPQQRMREAVDEVARELPSYQRVSDIALSRKPLPRTRLGKIQRHKLEEQYEKARAGGDDEEQLAPLDPQDMAGEDRALLERPAAAEAWELLAERYPKHGLTPDSNLQSEIGLDSMEWLNLTMEIGQRTGIELDEEAIGRIETARDLLQEMVNASGSEEAVADPVENPEQVLDERYQRWLEPRGPVLRAVGTGVYGVNRALLRSVFRLRVQGVEQVPEAGPCLLVCNHLSYLDAFAVAASLPRARLETLYWGGWRGVAFSTRLRRLFSRASQTLPIDPARGVRTSLALAAMVLQRERGLIWFPEGERSPSGELQPFRQGVGMLLAHHPVPVVPVIIQGSYQAWPRGQRLPRPRQLQVAFAEPVDARELAQAGEGDDKAARILDALHRHMRELVEGAGAGRD